MTKYLSIDTYKYTIYLILAIMFSSLSLIYIITPVPQNTSTIPVNIRLPFLTGLVIISMITIILPVYSIIHLIESYSNDCN